MLGGSSAPPPPAPAVVADGKGGSFLVWGYSPGLHERVISAQHVDAQGNRLWREKGKRIDSTNVSSNPGAVSDGMGGMIVTWRKGYGSSLERLDPAGNIAWKLENLGYRKTPPGQ
jgi:hypothetical protein